MSGAAEASNNGTSVESQANTAQSVVACCDELPGPDTDQPYDHVSWLRSMEDLARITKSGSDGKGHLTPTPPRPSRRPTTR